MEDIKDKKLKDMTSEDYFRIMISKNQKPSKTYIKEYGYFVKAEAELKAVKEVKSHNENNDLPFGYIDLIKVKERQLESTIKLCSISLVMASSMGYIND